MKKRYYVLIFLAAAAAALIINDLGSASFKIIKNDTAYAPESGNTAVYEQELSEPVNINTADVRLLKTLDGIGEAMAQRIVNYRTKNGNFEVIQDIMKVDGIGEKKFEKIRDYITTE